MAVSLAGFHTSCGQLEVVSLANRYFSSDSMFCDIWSATVPDWVSICVWARLLASKAKSAPRIVDREDSVCWIDDNRLGVAKPNRFCTVSKLER